MTISWDDYMTYINALTGYNDFEDDADAMLLGIIETQQQQHILDYTNQTTLPAGLLPALKARTVAQFLTARKADILGSDNLQIAKVVKEGDVQVELTGLTPESRLDAIIDELSKVGDLTCYRQIKW